MRYPNHIILDVSKLQASNITNNWTPSYTSLIAKTKNFNNTTMLIDNIILSPKSIASSNLSTVRIVNSVPSFKTQNFNSRNISKTNSLLWSLFDINFLKKEKMYTKLKYSRSPQYDIVSGGVAALFAGFLGFLISEKFGIELVDSGDFYTFFMYIVFLCFSTRPFLRIMSKKNTLYHFISLKFLFEYLYTITLLLFKFIKSNSFLPKTSSRVWIQLTNFFKTNEYISPFLSKFFKFFKFLKNYPTNK